MDGVVDSIEHGFFVREDQLARMRDRQISWVPTFAPIQKQIDHADLLDWDKRTVRNLHGILEQHAASLLKAHNMGVTIIAGSDAGSFGVAHGHGLFDELILMEQAGLSFLSAINAATGNGSRRLAFKEKSGQLKEGYRSRFMLMRDSPLMNLSELRKPMHVLFDGEVYESAENMSTGGL